VARSFVKELNRRNVFRVAIAYLVLAWLMAQVAELLLDAFGAPPWVLKSLFALMLVGFPIVVFFAWAFELTPEGVKLEREVDRERTITGHTGRKLDRAIIVLLLLAVAWFAWDRYRPGGLANPLAPQAEQRLTDDIRQFEDVDVLPVVAVLPFKATGSDDGGFLAAGLHDDLLTRLAKLEAFRVISRTSMMEYAGTTKNMRQIGQELGAGYILEGGVQAIGGRVRVNAQLIDASADQHIWADNYNREMSTENLFDVQAELAAAIAVAMQTSLSPSDLALVEEVLTENMAAYNAYLRGIREMGKPSGYMGTGADSPGR
jgi:TolB-like protein